LEHDEGVKARTKIVDHDTYTLGPQALEEPDGRWLDDIKGAKKYEARKLDFPGERSGNESEHLAGNFINDDVGRIVAMAGAGGEGCGWDSDGGGQCTVGQGSGNERLRGQVAGD
jgi:hypothetical protein